jgi:drug/metabolite transporter (DMT)-like permease
MPSPVPPAEGDRRRNLAGIGFMVLAVALFAVMEAGVKWLVNGYPLAEVMFFRMAFALVPLAPFLLRAGGLKTLRTRRPFGHLLRAVIGILAVGCFFYAFKTMPLADVTAVSFAAPLAMTALSVPLLKERVGRRRWAAVAVGFVGVLLIAPPGPALLRPDVLVLLAGTFLYACAMIAMRSLGRTESSVTIVFYFSLTVTAATGATLPWLWVTPPPGDALILAATGAVGGVAQLCLTQAVRLAPVSVVAPFDYVHIVFSAGLGFLVFGDVPAANVAGGAAVLIASGLYVLYREARVRRGP